MFSASMAVWVCAGLLLGQTEEKVLHKAGSIEVKSYYPNESKKTTPLLANMLLYHTIHWGLNYHRPANKEEWGDPDKDFTRLPTTYFHPRGPLGAALRRFNWFPGAPNTFHADAR